MPRFGIPIYKKAPILRILIPFIIGIIVQYYLNISLPPLIIVSIVCVVAWIIYKLFPLSRQFILQPFLGLVFNVFLFAAGGIISYTNNLQHQQQWVGNIYKNDAPVLVTLQEPIVAKAKSYKALSMVEAVYSDKKWIPVKGNILVYFKRDSSIPDLKYGSQIIIQKKLNPIPNAGNPGSFNYARYCAFQDIYYQTFLNDSDYVSLKSVNTFFFSKWLLTTRDHVLHILRTYIHNPNEISIAEALLIGYRDDLDRDLVQQYSSTGVVHIIAISGLHIAMIYGLMLMLFKPFTKYRWCKIVKPVVILSVLWGFTFIAGAAPSIMRSAVMFTFIVLGENFNRKTNIYNNLSLSAFLIILFNPYSLWDVGFQLSYSAVLSIVVFSKVILNWFYCKNKILFFLWELNAVTLSAQILTLPIVLFHFHQFPNLFLVTNIFAVPFSGIILYAELLLLIVSFVPFIAVYLGRLTGWCIAVMNGFIQHTSQLPFVVWPNIQINIIQVLLLYGFITGIAFWLMKKRSKGLVIGLSFLLAFIVVRSIDFVQRNQQQKLIVYNIPNHTGIDLIEGRHYHFIGDSILSVDGFLRNFHIKPSRVLNRVSSSETLVHTSLQNNLIHANGKNILIIDNSFQMPVTVERVKVDAIILTKNPKIYLSKLAKQFDCNLYIFDSSNPYWKINYWKKDAEQLGLKYFNTATQGAYEMAL